MKMFEQDGFSVRLIDQRPNTQAVQVNIYNPADAGHSYCGFVQTVPTTDQAPGTPEDLDTVFQMLVDSGVLGQMIDKAQGAFATPTPTE